MGNRGRGDISDCGSVIRPSIRDDQSDITINKGMPREEQFEQFARKPQRLLMSMGKSDNAVEQNSTITNKLSETSAPQVIMGVPRFPQPGFPPQPGFS
jgi:hypothetical protein